MYFNVDEQHILLDIIKSRRDVRGNRFTNKPISRKVVKKLIEAAIYAPSVGFSQPWEFVIVTEQDIKNKIHDDFAKEFEKSKEHFGDRQKAYENLKLEGIKEAPLNVAVFCKDSEDMTTLGTTSQQRMREYSVVCAIQNLWLTARSLNVGVGWVSILNPESVKEILAVPKDLKLIAYLCIGYVDKFYDKPELETKGWEKRRELKKCLHFNGYEKDKK